MTKRKIALIAIILIGILAYTMTNVAALSEPKKEIDVKVDSKSETINTNAKTVEDVLDEISHNHKKTDKLNHQLNDRIIHQMEIIINTEKDVSLSKGGNEIESIKTNATNVEELLDEKDIEIKENDIVIPEVDSDLRDEDKVVIIENEEDKYTKEKSINYDTDEQFSFNIPYGEREVVQEGRKGKREMTFKKIVKNDIVLSDEKIKTETIKKPKEEKVKIGTKEVITETIENEVNVKNNSSLYKGEKKVINEGNKGQREKIYRNDGEDRDLVSDEVVKEPVDRVIEKGTKSKPKKSKDNSQESKKSKDNSQSTNESSSNSSAKYSLSQFKRDGVINSNGKKFTYYSQSVLPGGGLKIPGRHINSGGYVADSNGYIVIASNSSISKGTVIDTPFGYQGKVYDICAACTPNWFDVYTE